MNPFTNHPNEMNESYWTHLWHSMIFSSRMFTAGAVCFLHGLLPFLFIYTTSDMLAKMTKAFLKRKPDDRRFETLSDL